MDGGYDLAPRGRARTGMGFEQETPLVIVRDGRRGQRGLKGDEGPPGPQGDGINVYDSWVLGDTYCPGDAVPDRSRLMAGITVLYIQKTSYPCAPLLEAPHENPDRWVEVGDQNWGDAYGGIWEVEQLDHGFTLIGQPVGFSIGAGRYVLANATVPDELGIAVVREVVDKDHVILQSTGEVPNIDPAVIYPAGSSWEAGRIYYVSIARGHVSLDAPVDNNAYVNPILMATDEDAQSGGRNGVALPWTPASGRPKEYIPVGVKKFYFLAITGQTVFDGVDLEGNLLGYIPGPNTDVFVNGLNLFEDAYTATDGFRVVLVTPCIGGEKVEIWTPDRPLDILVRSTTLKLDNIEAQFDGIRTLFDLYYNAAPVVFQDASSVQIWLDATNQEPLVDYQLVDNGGLFAVDFKEAPEQGCRFWAIALSPSGQAGVPSGGATGAVLMKASPADADMYWAEVIDGGTW